MAGRATQGFRKVIAKVVHPPFLRVTICAGEAAAAPPLGPQLGQRGIQIAPFCKQFNEQTGHLKAGIPLPSRITVNPDRSVKIVTHAPATTFLLKMAAGIKKGAMKAGNEVAGKVSLKHVYEIAKVKKADPVNAGFSMEQLCMRIIATSHSCGIEVVKELKPDEYGRFLEERRVVVQQQEEELEQIKQAKLLRL